MKQLEDVDTTEFDPARLPFSEDAARVSGYVRPLEPRSVDAQESTGGLAVEHGRITTMDGTMVAESFETRLTTVG